MSVQTDMELLYVHTLEEYAIKHDMDTNEVIIIFHENHVWSQMLLQYEYLHQVSLEETTAYVEEIIQKNNRTIVVYHGTNADFDMISLEQSHNKRDFGKGFYTTVLKQQAIEWAKRLCLRRDSGKPYVYEYLLCETAGLKVRHFDALTLDWLDFIKENRTNGKYRHPYDVIIGPVADDNTMETVQLYITGILNAEEAMSRLRYSKINNQISFHTERALKSLRFIRRESYEEK